MEGWEGKADVLEQLNKRTRRQLLRCIDVLTGVLFAVELAFLIESIVTNSMERTILNYVIFYWLIPSGLSIALCLLMHAVSAVKKISDTAKQYILILLLCLICVVIVIVHSYFIPTQCIFAAAIISAALIGNRKTIFYSFFLSALFLLLSVPVSAAFNRTVDLTLRFEYALVALVVNLMVAVLAFIVVLDRERSIGHLRESAQQLEHAVMDSKTDNMTGLYNHAEFYRILHTAPKVAKKVVIVVIDIDFFKRVNDTYGHDNGDRVILTIGSLCRKLNNDETVFAFRYGGEEFALIFFDTDTQKVLVAVEGIRRQMSAARYDFDPNLTVTLSAGVFSYNPYGYDPEDVFANADAALYYAKEHGRNQVHVYGEQTKNKS